MKKNLRFETLSIHAGYDPDSLHGGVMPSICMSTTFQQKSPGKHLGFDYTRASNPTRVCLEKCMAELEGGKEALALSSGCSAAALVLHLLQEGDHVLVSQDVYGGTVRLFNQVYSSLGLKFSFNDLSNIDGLNFQPNTKMVWLETPSNPCLKIFDLEKIAEKCRKKGVLLVVDNTFMTSFFQKPLQLGADIVVHSATKYLGGHSDILGGVAIASRKDLLEKMSFVNKSIGAVLSPFDSYLLLRSLKTLGARMKVHEENALFLADFLEGDKRVLEVMYPGLPTYKEHNLAKKQMSGFGGMLSFRLQGGLKEAQNFLENLKIFFLAESLGGVESLANHPQLMTHASLTESFRKKIGVTDNLIRLSVGIEHKEDLLWDIKQALDFVKK